MLLLGRVDRRGEVGIERAEDGGGDCFEGGSFGGEDLKGLIWWWWWWWCEGVEDEGLGGVTMEELRMKKCLILGQPFGPFLGHDGGIRGFLLYMGFGSVSGLVLKGG